ncbi:hypothetical protein H2204_004007 [Knufia peltigerae]|uniref:Uncharacterized protein n=1 Tax=Knufia peltigerae TaxID=1002370 RepID=A0AA38Y873_9EURO|nr:hypothetical protein H2204_004007 [Knufia peltigerae]
MTRLFDPYGSFRCSMCHRHPSIGWLYRCTQDSQGFLPESDFTGTPAYMRRENPMDVAATSLSNPVIKAIGQGQYIDDQVASLLKQKERVKDLVHEQDHRPTTSYSATTDASTADSLVTDRTFSTLPQSTTFSTTSSSSLEEEIRAAYDWNELQKVWMSEPTLAPPSSPRPRPAVLAEHQTLNENVREKESEKSNETRKGKQKEDVTPTCNFMVCPTCRPTYRDRAYWSLDMVLASPVQFPPIWEMENRRISDARTLMGIRTPPAERSSSHLTLSITTESMQSVPIFRIEAVDDADNVQAEPDSAESSSGQETDAHSVRKRSGFRQTVRRALARARLEDAASSSNRTDASDSLDQEPLDRPGSLIFRRRHSRSSTSSFVQRYGRIVDTSVLQESVTLMLARNTPVPQTPRVETPQSSQIPRRSRAERRGDMNTADVISQA